MDVNIAAGGAYIPAQRHRRLLKNHETRIFWLQLAADLTVVFLSLYVLAWLKDGDFQSHYRFLSIITALTMCGVYMIRGVYRQASGSSMEALRMTVAWSICISILLILGFVTKTSELFSRSVLISWIPLALALQVTNHLFARVGIRYYKKRFGLQLPVLVIGNGGIARHLVDRLNQNYWLPDQVVGMVRAENGSDDADSKVPMLGDVSSLRDVIRAYGIKRIYVALPLSRSEQVEGLSIDLLDLNVDVIWAPDIFTLNLLNHSVREVAGVPLISLNESPLTSSRVSFFLKDVMDRVIALVSLILLSPVFLAVAIAVKRSSPGPVFFKQDRHGFDGDIIKVWKFRSMKLHQDDEVVTQATKEDPRVTSVGRFIRKTSIDELPQLINVLQGTMSLVGPRPHAVSHNDYYADRINAYLARHRIKPGITGLAQINGFRGETETIDKMQKRVEFDLAYINTWSLALDLIILIKTPFTLFSKDIY